MLRCSFEITIGQFRFYRVESVRITSGWKALGDKATVVLPMISELLYPKRKGVVGIASGQSVVIKLGYDGKLVTEFTGYVKTVDPNNKLTIECEDEFWKLKQIPLNKSFRGSESQWQEILTYIQIEADIEIVTDVAGVQFGNWKLDYTAAAVFEALNKRGIYSYFRGKTLYCGLAYDFSENNKTVSYRVGENIMTNALKYRSADAVKLRVYAVGVQKDGRTAIEAFAGDPLGDQVKLYYYGIDSKAELEKLAELELKKYKFTGYEGHIHTWAVPIVKHGDYAKLSDPYTPGNEGLYYIDQVVTMASPISIERDVFLGIRLDVAK
jgi:hypothetical protein